MSATFGNNGTTTADLLHAEFDGMAERSRRMERDWIRQQMEEDRKQERKALRTRNAAVLAEAATTGRTVVAVATYENGSKSRMSQRANIDRIKQWAMAHHTAGANVAMWLR